MWGRGRFGLPGILIFVSIFAAGCSDRRPDLPPGSETRAPQTLVIPRSTGEIFTQSAPSTIPNESLSTPEVGIETSCGAFFPSVIQPIGYVPAPDAADPVIRELMDAGYVLFQAGAIDDENDGVYAIYLFTRLQMGEPVGKDTFTVVFYHRNGNSGATIGRFNPPVYTRHAPVFPSYYRLVNWDQPELSLMGLTALELPNQTTSLGLQGHSADLNQNGLPEVIFAGEYCPVNCLQTMWGVDVYEIGPGNEVVILTANLPGRLHLEPVLIEPLTFEVDEVIRYGQSGELILPSFYHWETAGWIETQDAASTVLPPLIDKQHDRIRAAKGMLTGRDGAEVALYSLLLLYERLGRPDEGLDAFTAAADLKQWPASDARAHCWLQLAAVRASDEHAAGRPFSLLPPLNEFSPVEDLGPILQAISGDGYDFSACDRWMP